MKVEMQKRRDIDIGAVLSRTPVEGQDAERKMKYFLWSSTEVWVGTIDDDVACVCGLIVPTILSGRAYLWMLHTNLVTEHTFLFIRHSQIWMQRVLTEYPEIDGHVKAANTRAIRWLKWLGAHFDRPQDDFIPFTITGNRNG